MKKTLYFVLLSSFFLAACSDDDNPGATGDPGPGAFDPNFKTSGLFFTNMSARVKGQSPHGAQQTWYSNNLKTFLAMSAFTAPEGSVSIKEFDMAADGTADGYAVMVKKPAGYDSGNHDWYYEMRALDGTLMAEPPAGKVAMCISCHNKFAATDYLGATKAK